MKNIYQKNKLEKIVVNIGIGKLSASAPNFEEKLLPLLVEDVALITGQKPAPRPAKKSIAGFKIREGNIVGLKVTLRGARMAQFLERLNKIVLPRLRDFKGIDLKNIDKQGNLSMGLKEHVVFPEINPETTKAVFGVEITMVPETRDKEAAINLYRSLGVPLKK